MNERGVTLVELLMALALGVVVLLGVATLYRSVAWSSKTVDAQANLQNQTALVVAELTRQVEAASTIEACYPDSGCLVGSCDGQDGSTDASKFLYVSQLDGSIYCFYKAGDQLREYCQPAGVGPHSCLGNMLSGSLAPLIVTSVDFSGTTGEMANVSFQLQAVDLLGGSSAAPTMTFAVGIAKRN